jgi:hypothetical protein
MRVAVHSRFWLDPGESYVGTFGGMSRRTITLRAVEVETEPLVVGNHLHEVFREARVTIELDGAEHELCCAPYELPREIAGLTLQADLVRELCGGTVVVPTEKAVRFAALDAGEPWTGDASLAFPISDYRWRAHVTRTHTWNGFVQVSSAGDGVYYHRGEDFGALPDRHDILSIAAGTLVGLPPVDGDDASNAIVYTTREHRFRYAHANASTIVRDPAPPRSTSDGAKLAKTGNTWDGHSTPDPHLHFGMYDASGSDRLNTYPYIVRAYQASYPEEPLPVGGGFRFVRAGEPVQLYAGRSVPAANGDTLHYRWFTSDGAIIDGESANMSYDAPGTYSEVLYCSDDQGREGYDVAIVRVSPADDSGSPRTTYAGPPFGYLNTYPVRGVKPGTEVLFTFNGSGTGVARIDFGDGTPLSRLEPFVELPATDGITHIYASEGWYVATLRCDDAGQGPAELKTVVRVEKG